jgi:hypothetical protein
MWVPHQVMLAAIGIATVISVLVGTAGYAQRLWHGGTPERTRALLWGILPASVGGFMGYVDGRGPEVPIGIMMTACIAAFISFVGVSLAVPENTRAFIGSAIFEVDAVVVWSYMLLCAAVSLLS